MSAFDPEAVPFYERRRGGGQVTEVMRRQERFRIAARLRAIETEIELATSSARAALGGGQRSLKDERDLRMLSAERSLLLRQLEQPARPKRRASRR